MYIPVEVSYASQDTILIFGPESISFAKRYANSGGRCAIVYVASLLSLLTIKSLVILDITIKPFNLYQSPKSI